MQNIDHMKWISRRMKEIANLLSIVDGWNTLQLQSFLIHIMCALHLGLERPRTGGWSLPGVMSYWQCGMDWLLAE
jgi:hypothetical protein